MTRGFTNFVLGPMLIFIQPKLHCLTCPWISAVVLCQRHLCRNLWHRRHRRQNLCRLCNLLEIQVLEIQVLCRLALLRRHYLLDIPHQFKTQQKATMKYGDQSGFVGHPCGRMKVSRLQTEHYYIRGTTNRRTKLTVSMFESCQISWLINILAGLPGMSATGSGEEGSVDSDETNVDVATAIEEADESNAQIPTSECLITAGKHQANSCSI